MQVLARRDDLSQVLRRLALTKAAFPLDQRVDLAFGRILQYQVERVIILIVIVELDDVGVVQFVHNLDL